jgi:NADH-quinone oxidoreductase subunit C
MSPTAEQLALELEPLAVAEFVPLPPPPPPPKPVAARPAAAPAAPGAAAPAPVAAPATPPAPPPTPPKPVQICDFSIRGVHLDATLRTSEIVNAAQLMLRHGFAIDTITGVDWMAQGLMEVVYDFFHPISGLRVALRCRVARDKEEVPTISGVFQGANWHERETHDFFGIRFSGHPNLTPFLLPEDATYHPLRRDFTGEAAQ